MNEPALSVRGRAVRAATYAAFPVESGAVDLRGDHAPTCINALMSVTSKSLGNYEDVQGDERLRDLLGARFQLSRRHVVIANGASEAIALALLTTVESGAIVAIPAPGFPGYRQLSQLFGLRTLRYLVGRELTKTCVMNIAGANLTVFLQPHNPCGLNNFSDELAYASDGWRLRDLSHCSSYLHTHSPITLGPQDIVVGTLSKVLRVPALRVGFLISSREDVVSAAVAIKTHLSMSTACPSQHLAIQMLTSPDLLPGLVRQQEELSSARRTLVEATSVSKSLIPTGGRSGSHFLVESKVSMSEEALWHQLAEAGIIGLPGSVFDSPYPSVRLSCAQPRGILEIAAERLMRC